MSNRSALDRIQYDGDQLDEIVLTGVTFHIERMSHHGWWMNVRDPDTGESVDFWWTTQAGILTEEGHWQNVEKIDRPPLAYHCKTTWTDRHYGEHQCEVDKPHARHRCECGKTHKGDQQ